MLSIRPLLQPRLRARLECALLRSSLSLVTKYHGLLPDSGLGSAWFDRRAISRSPAGLAVFQAPRPSLVLECGIAEKFPSPSLDSRHPQTSHASLDRRPVGTSSLLQSLLQFDQQEARPSRQCHRTVLEEIVRDNGVKHRNRFLHLWRRFRTSDERIRAYAHPREAT